MFKDLKSFMANFIKKNLAKSNYLIKMLIHLANSKAIQAL